VQRQDRKRKGKEAKNGKEHRKNKDYEAELCPRWNCAKLFGCPGVQSAGSLDIHFTVGISCKRAAPLAERNAAARHPVLRCLIKLHSEHPIASTQLPPPPSATVLISTDPWRNSRQRVPQFSKGLSFLLDTLRQSLAERCNKTAAMKRFA
jgi:hypothetical protein